MTTPATREWNPDLPRTFDNHPTYAQDGQPCVCYSHGLRGEGSIHDYPHPKEYEDGWRDGYERELDM